MARYLQSASPAQFVGQSDTDGIFAEIQPGNCNLNWSNYRSFTKGGFFQQIKTVFARQINVEKNDARLFRFDQINGCRQIFRFAGDDDFIKLGEPSPQFAATARRSSSTMIVLYFIESEILNLNLAAVNQKKKFKVVPIVSGESALND